MDKYGCAKSFNTIESKNKSKHRAVVVERSNVLVYLMINVLELKVEGSNPRYAETSFCFAHARARIIIRESRVIRESRTNAHAQFSAHAHATSIFGMTS